MTNAAKIREALNKAKVYKAKIEAAGDDASKLPAYDQKSEALIPVLNHEIPLKAHAHQANDIFTHRERIRCRPDSGACDRGPYDRG